MFNFEYGLHVWYDSLLAYLMLNQCWFNVDPALYVCPVY